MDDPFLNSGHITYICRVFLNVGSTDMNHISKVVYQIYYTLGGNDHAAKLIVDAIRDHLIYMVKAPVRTAEIRYPLFSELKMNKEEFDTMNILINRGLMYMQTGDSMAVNIIKLWFNYFSHWSILSHMLGTEQIARALLNGMEFNMQLSTGVIIRDDVNFEYIEMFARKILYTPENHSYAPFVREDVTLELNRLKQEFSKVLDPSIESYPIRNVMTMPGDVYWTKLVPGMKIYFKTNIMLASVLSNNIKKLYAYYVDTASPLDGHAGIRAEVFYYINPVKNYDAVLGAVHTCALKLEFTRKQIAQEYIVCSDIKQIGSTKWIEVTIKKKMMLAPSTKKPKKLRRVSMLDL